MKERLQRIRCIVSDVDGVLTEGKIYLDENGKEIKVFCAKDAPRIVAAIQSGLVVILFTGRKGGAVSKRAEGLGTLIFFKADMAGASLLDLIHEKYGFSPEEILYIGDDWNDLYYMMRVGVAVTPGDATLENKEVAHIVTTALGGQGVASEAIELVMRAQDTWEAAISYHREVTSG